MVFQNEHLDEDIKDVKLFSAVADKEAVGELAPYLLNIFFKICHLCIRKHSLRADSQQVSIILY